MTARRGRVLFRAVSTGHATRWALLIAAWVMASSCTVSKSEGDSAPGTASCKVDSNCPSNMTCEQGLCHAAYTVISKVLVDVRLPESANLAQYSNMGFVLEMDVPSSGQRDVILPSLTSLNIRANLSKIGDRGWGCSYSTSADAVLPIAVTATHRWPVDGMERTVFTASSSPATFPAVPVDKYEVYLAPSGEYQAALSTIDTRCQLPPLLVRDVATSDGSPTVVTWPAPKVLDVDVQLTTSNKTQQAGLQGWQLDLVDPIGARELAVPIKLAVGVADEKNSDLIHHRASLYYNPIASATSPPAKTELLRLKPPDGVIAPTYYASLSSQSLFTTSGQAVLAVGAIPSEVRLTGRVETQDGAVPVAADIAATSTSFGDNVSGVWADYHATAHGDVGGEFEIRLPAGQYRVTAVPPNDNVHAIVSTNWTIQASISNQGGRLLTVPPMQAIRGTVDSSVSWGNASASIQASPRQQLSYDSNTGTGALHSENAGVRTASILFQPAANNAFQLAVDPGTYDLSMRTPDGVPWVVVPGLAVSADVPSSLRPWVLPLPVPWIGRVRVPSTVTAADGTSLDVPRAVIRIFVLLAETDQPVASTKDAASIVQIAEARSAADGSFSLVVPDRLEQQ